MPKKEIFTTVCDNPTTARYGQRMLGRRVEPVSCGAFIGSEIGGVYEYVADVRGVEAQGRGQGWLDLEEGALSSS